MNKLRYLSVIVLVGACHIVAMDRQLAAPKKLFITEENAKSFSRHFSMVMLSVNRMVAAESNLGQNPIVLSLNRLSTTLQEHQNNVSKMLKKDQDLTDRLLHYRDCVNSHPLVILAQDQIVRGQGDTAYIKTYLEKTQQAIAGLELREKYPVFFIPSINGIHDKDKGSSIYKNADYPSDENAQRDYIAFFLYLTLPTTSS